LHFFLQLLALKPAALCIAFSHLSTILAVGNHVSERTSE